MMVVMVMVMAMVMTMVTVMMMVNMLVASGIGKRDIRRPKDWPQHSDGHDGGGNDIKLIKVVGSEEFNYVKR